MRICKMHVGDAEVVPQFSLHGSHIRHSSPESTTLSSSSSAVNAPSLDSIHLRDTISPLSTTNAESKTIPQERYSHASKAARTRYGSVTGIEMDSISFRLENAEEDGVSLSDILDDHGAVSLLGGKDELLQDHGVNVTLHILVRLICLHINYGACTYPLSRLYSGQDASPGRVC